MSSRAASSSRGRTSGTRGTPAHADPNPNPNPKPNPNPNPNPDPTPLTLTLTLTLILTRHASTRSSGPKGTEWWSACPDWSADVHSPCGVALSNGQAAAHIYIYIECLAHCIMAPINMAPINMAPLTHASTYI